MKRRRIIVIGGGPAGMMAAGQAALLKSEVLLLERMSRPGRKLRITGKGRCNLTNNAARDDFIRQFGRGGKFLHQAFARFFSDDLVSFVNNLGVETELERGGRIFPKDNRAQDIVDAMIRWLGDCGVKISSGARVSRLLIENEQVTGVLTDGKSYPADRVVIATGGKSYPATGSTGDGYRLAEAVGHTVIPTRPALVPVITKGRTAAGLQGLGLKNVAVKVLIDGKKKTGAFGEMLFTHFGLSGPIILTLSGIMVDALSEKKEVTVTIDLKPALDEKKLNNRLLREIKENNKKQYANMLKNLLPHKLIPTCIEQTGIPAQRMANEITADERKRLRLWLKDFRFQVVDHRGFNEAVVTAGGINLKEINPSTLESRIIKNLFFAGEILDLNGATGGYNLQAAFSTGYLAGISAAK